MFGIVVPLLKAGAMLGRSISSYLAPADPKPSYLAPADPEPETDFRYGSHLSFFSTPIPGVNRK